MFNTLIGRLYLLSVLVVVPFYILIYLSFDYSRSIVKDELRHSAQFVSSQAVENQEHLVSATQVFLSSLASSSQVQSPDSITCKQFVSDITPLFGNYINIGVPNDQGILTCNGTLLDAPVDVTDRDYIRNSLTQKRFTTSGLHLDRATGVPTINFAYPVQSYSYSNEVVGAAVAVVSLAWWSELLSNSKLPEKSVAFILDEGGNAVVSFPANTEYEKPTDFNTIMFSKDGVSRVFTQHKVLDENNQILLSFVTGVAIDEPLRRINNRYTVIVFGFSALVVILLILIRFFFVDAIAKPLSKLSKLAKKLGRNEPIGEVKSTGIKEMDALQDSFIEMAERKTQAENRIILQSQTDSLTGISNREAFISALDQIFQERQGQQSVAIVLIDLDNFKDINARGHDIGDAVLKVIASRLAHKVSSAHHLSCLGGDEFIFLLEGDNAQKDRALALCERVKNIIAQPILLEHGNIEITASIGASFYPHDGDDVKSIMSATDQAMYLAKQNGRNAARCFSKDLKDAYTEKMSLVKDLRHAMSNDEFFLVYQPILNAQGNIIKFEALIRWQHPEKGLIPPDQFIGLAEEFGQIIEIGIWVIQEAKRALVSIRQVYGDSVQVSVNVSPAQLSRNQGDNGQLLSEFCTDKMRLDHREERNSLIVEITENLLMNSDENTRNLLLAFREHGVQVALDDFGTGYSSLAYIMNYDIDYLKIDKSFVQELEKDLASQTLCETIISMAHTLGVEVVAEGVETKEQADLLLSYGCDFLQGFYFSKPVPLNQILAYKQDRIT